MIHIDLYRIAVYCNLIGMQTNIKNLFFEIL